MRYFIWLIIFISCMYLLGCQKPKTKIYMTDSSQILYAGRIDKSSVNGVTLIGSASSVMFNFSGDSCAVYLKNNTPDNLQNYLSLELDGEYIGRIRIEGETMTEYPIEIKNGAREHTLKLFKATESQNGYIIFGGLRCNALLAPPKLPEKSVEFIGNSITCGQGIALDEVPCDIGQWYDQHNAYLAYGPIVARKLNVNFILSSVSGIGIYRNWNGVGPTMPMVYENCYLNTDTTKRWDFSRYIPDLVSICLGTNDFSDGDGVHERLPFSAEEFTSKYIDFVQTVFNHYPETRIVFLNSPMLSADQNKLLNDCLEQVRNHFGNKKYKPVEIFKFSNIVPGGCDSHPGKEDHQLMAEQLYPYFKAILDKL